MTFQKVLLVVLCLGFAGNVAAEMNAADAVKGQQIFNNQCAGCHGPAATGMPTPNLFGQRPQYIVTELRNFREDKRADKLLNFMNSVAKGLSDQDMSDLAAYLTVQDPCSFQVPVNPKKGNVEEGRKKVEQWICAGCHSPGSQYFVGDKYDAPYVKGQKTDYLVYELQQFRAKTRVSRFMNDIMGGMSNSDIDNLAAYWNSLRNCTQ